MLPAWLGKTYSSPIRSHLIVHGADGNFAIRRGSYKWIEGVYHPDTKPGAIRMRKDQYHKQLYDLRTDIAEAKEITDAHSKEATELEALLNRYRTQSHSR
jgi:hypothetical protein